MGDNKFVSIGVFFAFLVVSGGVYQAYYQPPELAPVKPTGKTVVIEMRSVANQWRFEPERPEVTVGDKVVVKIFNEDTYDHGWALEVFGVNKRLFPRKETEIEFMAAKVGEHSFYCSVPCGEGHYRQKGVLIVKPQEEAVPAVAPSP